jgi:predicted MFS family arabinose efflux permease
VAYKQRGVVIAFIELGWSGAFLLGVPVMGWLIARGDWRAPFWPLAGVSAALGVALWRLFPATPGGPVTSRPASAALLGAILRSPPILGALSISLLVSASNEVLNAVYGLWLEQAFHLKVAALGLTTIAIGLAELGGEGVVMAVVDRVGKRRTIAVALAASALANALLPFMAGSLPLALIGLFLVFITFEIAIVASLPLMTEQLPQARGFMMSVNVAAHGAGRMLGALMGGWLFPLGFGWNAAVSVAMCLIPLAAVVWLVREHPEAH